MAEKTQAKTAPTPAPVTLPPPPKPPAPAPVIPEEPRLAFWEVKIPHCRPRVVDREGRITHRDSLVVRAWSRGQAIERFMSHMGMIKTEHIPEVREVFLPLLGGDGSVVQAEPDVP